MCVSVCVPDSAVAVLVEIFFCGKLPLLLGHFVPTVKERVFCLVD